MTHSDWTTPLIEELSIPAGTLGADDDGEGEGGDGPGTSAS